MASPGRLLATYPLLPTFQYCEKLDCYVDRLDLLDPDLPGPHPPPTKKDEIFDLKKFDDVDERAINTPDSYHKETLKELVDYLIKDYENDMEKIRVIYRWITCQPINMIQMKKEPPQNYALFQLWRIKNKKGNYAQLVSLLCRHAGIPCVIIHGALKGSTYEVGDEIDEERHYGEWNAVLIDGHWRFINAYWGTCAESASDDKTIYNDDEAENRVYYNCDENYFLTDPDQVVATHLPKSPFWQLKAKPVTVDEFERMAFVKDRYFNLKLKTLSHHQCVVRSDTGEVELKFEVPGQKSLNIDFQYLLFRIKDDNETRIDRYAFMHRTNGNKHLTVRIRSPVACVNRFELVGKDLSCKDEYNDYDWIVIYKIIFTKGMENCQQFPPPPEVGWGPTLYTKRTGLVPLSDFTGEIFTDDIGKAEIKFGAANKMKIGEMHYTAKLYTGGATMEEISDCVVHRVEDGDVIFNVMTPKQGEYVLRLFLKDEVMERDYEFCDYLVISKQREENGKFPLGYSGRLGPKVGFGYSGLQPTRPSGFINTEQDQVYLGFCRTENIELSVNLSGENIQSSEAHTLLSQTEAGNMVSYTVKLPESGQYGVRIRGTRDYGAPHEAIYDYVVDYRKIKKRTKKDPTIQEDASKGPDNASLSDSSLSDDDSETNGKTNGIEELLHATEKSSNGTDGNSHDGNADEEEDIDTYIDKLRRRLRMSVEEHDQSELRKVVIEMRKLQLASVQPDIKFGEEELIFILIKKELLVAIRDKDSKKLKAALKKVKQAGFGDRLYREVEVAKNLQKRLKKLQRLLHAVLDLDQSTIAEIRGYSKPPEIVKTVMRATLLLLGHWKEETANWKNIQVVVGKTGRESLKRLIQEFKIDNCPLEVALGAKEFLQGYCIEQVRLVSAGCATFYVWVRGVVEEIEQRAGEEINNIRPRTSQGKRGKKKKQELTFLRDIEA